MPGRDSPTDIDVHNAAISSALSRFQCSFPAIVTAPAAADGRVQVQPAIRIPSTSRQSTSRPVTIPVAWPSWGDIVIQGVLEVGDEVLVRCQDKNWLAWLETGGVADDVGVGGHQAGYAVAEPVQISVPRRAPPLAPTDALRIGRKDSLTTIVLGVDGSITLNATEVSMTAGEGVSKFLTDLHTQVAAWVPVANDGGAALKAALVGWLALIPPTGGNPPP